MDALQSPFVKAFQQFSQFHVKNPGSNEAFIDSFKMSYLVQNSGVNLN